VIPLLLNSNIAVCFK